MATALANSSPIPRRSNTVPHPKLNTKIGTSNLQQQNIPATQSLDDKVEQLLVRSRSPMGKDDARKMSEVLDKMLEPHHPISLPTRRRCFRELVRLCGEHGILPSLYMISGFKIRKLTEAPVSTSGFSCVWRGIYNEEKRVAIKAVQYEDSDNVQQIKKGFCREVITWRRLSHPNILELVGVVMNESEFIMVAPWMENGNIVDHVREDPHANPLKLLEDATRGLKYLHSVDLAHGDLKGANILVSDAGQARLADVGLTRIAGELISTATSDTSSSGGGHTLRWCPPELLDPERFGFTRSNPTKKSDIYSMAMTTYEVLTDKVPFHGYGDLVAMYYIIEGVRPTKPNFVLTRGYTEELWAMTTSCWNEVATERPIVDHVLEVLEAAAERWKSRYGGSSTLSPTDSWSQTLHGEESGSPAISESEDEPIVTDIYSTRGARSPTIEIPVPATPPSPPIPPPSTAKDKGESRHTHATVSHEEEGAKGLSPKPTSVTFSKKQRTKPLMISSQEERPLELSPFQDLVELCEESGMLPRSCIVPASGLREPSAQSVSSGGFSDIRKGQYGDERELVAIKTLRSHTAGVEGIKKRFCREAIIWKHLSHSNVLRFIGAIMNDQKCVMISPWMEGGTIVEFLKRNYYNPLELLEGAAQGLQYLHGMGLVHGDLKGANILVSKDRRACLTDFGHVVFEGDLKYTATTQKSTCIGTPRWCPPELFDRRELGFSWDSPSKMSDIYSMAMTIYEVLTGAPPFCGHGKTAAMNRIIRGERPPEPIFSDTRGYTPELWEMTTRCWKQEPAERPTVGDTLYALKIAVGKWDLSPSYDWTQAPSAESGSLTQTTQ